MKNKKTWEPHVGDRVVSTDGVGNMSKIGVYGTIRHIDSDNSFLVEFDEPIGGHNGSRVLQTSNGWWCGCYNTKLINSANYPVITIQTDGKTTTATLREGHKVLNTAKAICCEEDEFDYLTGAKLALERVMGKEEEQEELKKPKKFEIGMRVKDSRYGFDWGYVTHIRENNKGVFITPLDCMNDFLKNGAKEHKNCFMIDENCTTILEDEED